MQVEKGKYNITEGFVAAACDSFGIVHHGIKQFIRRAGLYATSRLVSRAVRHARKTLIEIYRNAFSQARGALLFKNRNCSARNGSFDTFESVNK